MGTDDSSLLSIEHDFKSQDAGIRIKLKGSTSVRRDYGSHFFSIKFR